MSKIEKVREALGQIANHWAMSYDAHGWTADPDVRQYQMGVTDGHRCAAGIARDALTLLEGVEVERDDSMDDAIAALIDREAALIADTEARERAQNTEAREPDGWIVHCPAWSEMHYTEDDAKAAAHPDSPPPRPFVYIDRGSESGGAD